MGNACNEKESCILLDSFAETLGVEIYAENTNYISAKDLQEELKKYCGDVEIVRAESNILVFSFKDYVIETGDEKSNVEIGISINDNKANMEKLETAFNQSWRHPIIKNKVMRSEITIIVAEINGSNANYKRRLELFQKAIYAIMKVIPSIAIYWPLTQQILASETVLKNDPNSKYYDILIGAFNVRVFKANGVENDILVDTLGLGALGLVDFQCRAKNIEPQIIANTLYNYAYESFEDGNIPNDGDVIRGISPGNGWTCKKTVSTIEPKRMVLNIIPV